MTNKLLVKKITTLCKEKGLTIHQLSVAAGIAPKTLYRLSEKSSGMALHRIAKILGTTLEDLIKEFVNVKED